MKTMKILGLAATLVAVLVARHAVADVKAFHGAGCFGFSDDPDPDVTGFHTSEGFAVIGSGTNAEVVVCPLLRDRVDNTDSLVNVYVEGHNAVNGGEALEFNCTLVSQEEDSSGDTLDSHNRKTTTLGNLQLGPFAVASSSGNEGAYTMECLLQDEEYVYHVYVNESNAASD